MKRFLGVFLCVPVCILLTGCSDEKGSRPENSNTAGKPPATSTSYLLESEPDGGKHVIAAREAWKDGDNVVVVGRIGGSENPWVDGRLAFTIVDPAIEACSDIPGDDCPVPWDYCCRTDQLATGSAFVKIVGENGKVLAGDAKSLLKLTELQTVVVKGVAKRVDDNMTILATGLFARAVK